jgi:hypothetical protein
MAKPIRPAQFSTREIMLFVLVMILATASLGNALRPEDFCARLFQRSAHESGRPVSIAGTGAEIKMKLGPRPNGRRPWTPEEDAQLLALLESKMDRNLIARKLKRTVVAINIRLGVQKAKAKWTE